LGIQDTERSPFHENVNAETQQKAPFIKKTTQQVKKGLGGSGDTDGVLTGQ
jgi:hypothetical protein